MPKIENILRLCIPLIVIGSLYWIAGPSNLTARYQNYRVIYNKTFLHKGNIDIAVSGSSRSSRIAGPVELEGALTKKLNRDEVIAYNFAKGGRDIVIDYAILKEYLREHCVGTVLFEYNQTGRTRYPHSFENIAPYGVIWDTYLNDSFYSWPERVQKALRAFTTKILESFYFRFSEKLKLFDQVPQPVRTINVNAKANVEVMARRIPDENYWDLKAPKNFRQTRYVKKVIHEAKKYGTKVIFYYPPTLESAPLTPQLVEEFEAEFGHPLYQLNQSQLDDMRSSRTFADYNHVNQSGREFFIPWMVENFDIQLAEDAACSSE